MGRCGRSAPLSRAQKCQRDREPPECSCRECWLVGLRGMLGSRISTVRSRGFRKTGGGPGEVGASRSKWSLRKPWVRILGAFRKYVGTKLSELFASRGARVAQHEVIDAAEIGLRQF